MAATPGDHPLAAQAPPTGLDPPAAAAWRGRVVRAVEEAVQPALAHLRAVLRDELLPVARADERPGLCHLDGGRGDYERLLWASTSLPLTADAVHDLGLEQLAALDGEYRTLGPDCVGTADPVEVRERLRSDPTLRYASVAEILTDARAMLARAEAEAGRWFLRLPRAACTARALTTGPAAFYTGPSPDGFRGGTFFLNATDPSSWSRYQLEATAFHEGVPGHHLQVALGQELRLHPVLGELEVDSFSEGWGLYAERLADEMGLYSTPLQRLGMVTLDSMRAARLVVDTGLHDRGWTRSEAVEFMFGRTAQPRASVVAEVDRYIADAGQAVSYLVGRQELRRLRDGAERALGDRFDIRSFHDRVLRHGMAPFPALARSLDAWACGAGARPP
ncbi:MAG TPA: DUF885 domain-containing protein [Acidimicrobiales bacterium]|nr:DUF885 domain-containing protein [Acidimicrobiales bacterium]